MQTLQSYNSIDRVGEVIRSCGCANTYDKPSRPKTTRIWYHVEGYIELEGDDIHDKSFMKAEVAIGRVLTTLGGTMLVGSAPRGQWRTSCRRSAEALETPFAWARQRRRGRQRSWPWTASRAR